jgi:hypothetical protein
MADLSDALTGWRVGEIPKRGNETTWEDVSNSLDKLNNTLLMLNFTTLILEQEDAVPYVNTVRTATRGAMSTGDSRKAFVDARSGLQ